MITIRLAVLVTSAILIGAAWRAPSVGAQAPSGRTVWDAVYTPEQARRGEMLFTANCVMCHMADLSGGGDANGDAPALAGPTFMSDHEGYTLDRLFTFMKTNMPPDNAGGLQDEEYVAVLAYVLEANEFPSGTAPLPAMPDALSAIRIEPQGGLTAPANFSLVRIVACLTRDAGGGWVATRASAPVLARVVPTVSAGAQPLGDETFRLISIAQAPDALAGQKIEVSGLLIRSPSENRINVETLKGVATTCG